MSGMMQLLECSRIADEMNDPQSWYRVLYDCWWLTDQCKVCSLDMQKSHGLVHCLACRNRLHEECADKWFSNKKNPKECVYCKSSCWKVFQNARMTEMVSIAS